jgi:CO/xanthine dehydrogenase Mo-binding subunit
MVLTIIPDISDDRIAAVAARSCEEGEAAARAIEIEYLILPGIFFVSDAIKKGRGKDT